MSYSDAYSIKENDYFKGREPFLFHLSETKSHQWEFCTMTEMKIFELSKFQKFLETF